MQIVFITNHPEQVPNLKEITALRTNTPRAVFSLARAKVWVDNNRKEAYIRKRKGQYYIQLWHGGIALKRIEGDCEALLGRTYIRRAKEIPKTRIYLCPTALSAHRCTAARSGRSARLQNMEARATTSLYSRQSRKWMCGKKKYQAVQTSNKIKS